MKKFKIKVIRLLALLAAAGLFGFVLILLLNLYMQGAVISLIVEPDEAKELDADCILILGCGVKADQTPSNMLEDRLKKGISLYEAGASKRLLMSGDYRENEYDEVNVMKQFAVREGIDSEAVFIDPGGYSTYESMYRAREVFQADRVIIVTQKYHLYRALYIAKQLGLDARGVAAEDIHYNGWKYRELRELLARTKDFFTVMAKPEPANLGEKVSLADSGDRTDSSTR